MNTRIGRIGVVSALFFFTSAAWAGPADHLQCFKIKDSADKAKYVADLTPSDANFPVAPGCTIQVPAKQLCIEVDKSNVVPTPPGSSDGATAQQYLCYKAKCPKAQPTTTVTDQFGSHDVAVKATSLVCAPLAPAATPTCTDSISNGLETGVDCGGGVCPDCGVGGACLVPGDCVTGLCTANVCASIPPICQDFVKDGFETDVDCGGSACPACGAGDQCLVPADCTSGICSSGFCQ